jgi:hypothetical protein
MVGPAIFGVVRDCLKMMKMGDTRKVAERMENWMSHGIVGFCPYFSILFNPFGFAKRPRLLAAPCCTQGWLDLLSQRMKT